MIENISQETDLLKKINPSPRDQNIEFDEDSHTYKVQGKQLKTSVTAFVKSIFPLFDKDNIVDKILRSNKMCSPLYKYYGMNSNQIIETWKTQTILGTILHHDIERFYNQLEPFNTSKEYDFFLNFVRHNTDLTPYRTEWRIYSSRLNIGGSIDIVYQLPNGHHAIRDWKRSCNINMIDNYGKYCLFPGLENIPDTNYGS